MNNTETALRIINEVEMQIPSRIIGYVILILGVIVIASYFVLKNKNETTNN